MLDGGDESGDRRSCFGGGDNRRRYGRADGLIGDRYGGVGGGVFEVLEQFLRVESVANELVGRREREAANPARSSSSGDGEVGSRRREPVVVHGGIGDGRWS